MKKFVLASKNKHKAQEIKEILGSEYEIITMDEAGIGNLEIIEDGATFEENAAKKAAQVYNAVKLPTIADDSGLCVDYLNGAPGIYTARFAGENAADEDNINKLLSELDGIEHEKRTAKFVCVIAFIDGKTDKPQFFAGSAAVIYGKKNGVRTALDTTLFSIILNLKPPLQCFPPNKKTASAIDLEHLKVLQIT